MPSPTSTIVSSSGTTTIDAMLNGGKWLTPNLTWATADNPYQFYAFLDPIATAALIVPMLQQFSNVSNLQFQSSGHFSDFTESTADITVTISDASFFGSVDVLGRAIFPLTNSGDALLLQLGATRTTYPQPEGDIAISATTTIFSNPIPGSEGFYAALHEIGHAVGLKHPHDNGAGGFPTFVQAGMSLLDSCLFTVMSYNRPFSGLLPQTLGILDIAALQHLYGANMSYRAGDDGYALQNNGTLQTLWDAGGSDTFDASGLATATLIDLAGGAFSVTQSSVYGIAIGAVIENAVGGSGSDDIYGNSVANSLGGNAGVDFIFGYGGDDILDGGAGADQLIGGVGNDTYAVDSVFDVVTELASEGSDTVRSSTLNDLRVTDYANIENLTYTGSSSFIGQGDGNANVIIGGSANDYVYAYGGDDTARGNAGVDVFIMADGADTVFGGDGQDYMFGEGGNDTLNGEAGVDVFLGGDGADTMFGGDEGDYFYGEIGDDIGFGENGNDIFVMTAGNDTATGGAGQDYFYMGDGNDTLNGGDGVDVMLGEAGDDTFNPGLSVDYVFMGTGTDRLNVDRVLSGVTVLNDFTAGAASNDTINLTNSFTSFAQVQANISDFTASGGFCILTLDADTSIWFIGVTPAQLTAGDFIFGGT